MKNSSTHRAVRAAGAWGAILLAVLLPAAAIATSLQLDFTVPSSFNESNRQAVLEWNAEPGKTYLIQSADDLAGTNGWKDVDLAARSSVGPIRWTAPDVLSQQKFYRLILPQPTVYSVAPAWVDANDPGSLLYLYGQCLPTNGSVVVNGQNFTPTLVDPNGTWVAISLNGLPPGTPVIGNILVLDGGSNVVTTVPLQSPVVYGTEPTVEQLQGPPDDPPASPQAVVGGWLSKKGYDYYKAQSDLSAAGLQNNPAFQDNGHQGEMPASASSRHRGHVTVLKAMAEGSGGQPVRAVDYRGHVTVLKSHYDGDFEGSGGAELSAHKKGLNAVKVKLAYSSGELQCDEMDLVIPGRGLDFAWTRSYRSRTGPNTAQGAGWDFSYNVSLSLQPDGTALLRSGDGRADTFYPDGTNGWVRNEHFVTIGDLDQDGHPDLVTFADTGKWVFKPQRLSSAASGKLDRIEDRNGNTIRCEYDAGSGRLLRVVDTLDRTNSVAYNAAGQIVGVTDFSGRTVSYEYDGHGDLVACVSPAVTGTPNGNDFPGGKTNRYAYSSGFADARLNHNLISCTDAKGQTWLQVAYQTTNNPAAVDFDAVDYVLRGIDKKDIRRGMVVAKPGSPPRMRAIVNDGVGNVCEAYYDSHHRLVELQEYTGRANPTLPTTDSDNRPAGKLRDDDPDLFVTRFEWNADSLCTKITSPGGHVTELVYQRAFNQNSSRSNNAKTAAHRGDLRLRREVACCDQDDDGDGLVDPLVSTFEYDPRFGSPALRSKKLFVGGLSFADPDPAGITGRGTVAPGKIETGLMARKGGDGRKILCEWIKDTVNHRPAFITSATDPRGGVSTSDYDTAGNLLRFRKRPELLFQAWEESYAYNASGQLTAITNAPDATGYRRVDTFSYHTSGSQAGFLQAETCDATGLALTTSYEYDSRGNLTRVVDPRGNDWLYTYNALDELIRSQTPTNLTARGQTDFRYDANGNLQEAIEELRDDADVFIRTVTTRADYDFLNRCTALAEQVAPGVLVTNQFFYDGNGRLVAAHSPLAVSGVDPHNTVAFEYDERGLLFREVGAPGSGNSPTNQYDYTPNGACHRINKIESLTIKQSTISYDGFDRPVAVTDAMSNVVNYVYDRNGNVTALSRYGETNDVPGAAGNQLLSHTTFTYDGLDRQIECRTTHLSSSGTPVGDGAAVTAFAYAPNGACLSVTDDNGHTTGFAYDSVGRLASTTDPKLNVTTFTYDAGGNALSETWADRSDLGGPVQQSALIHAYDRLHRLTRTVDNVGNTNRYAYDSRGNLALHTNPRGNDVAYQYDDLRRLTDTRRYVGARSGGITINTSHVEYDAKNRVVASTDSNTNTTTYAYDSLDRCGLVTEADGTSRSLIWSPRSNLLRQQNANGTVISNSFDLLERCVRRDILPGPTVASTTTFELFAHDGLSRLTLASNDLSRVALDYDSLGNCVRQVQDEFSSDYTYDGAGNRLAMTYPSGRGVTFAYDALDQVSAMSSSSGGLPPVTLATFAYDGPGRLSRIARANNVSTRLQWNGLVNPANGAGDFGWQQVSAVNHQVAGGGSVVDRRVAAYDRNQNKIARTQTVPFFEGGPTTTNFFAYDALDRMTDFVLSTGQPSDLIRTYGLDGNGNRLVGSSNGVAAPYVMDSTFPNPADFQMNQYTLTPFVLAPELYDANGNLVSRVTSAAQLQYVYDYADRLVAVQDLTGGAPQTVVTYRYDALSRRIGKTSYPAGLPAVVTQFACSAPQGDSDGDTIEDHVGGSLRRTYCFPHVFDQKGRVMFTDGGETFYFHTDELGNTLALTDAGGNVVERCDYDDFGAPIFLSLDGFPTGEPESGVGNPHLFRGMEWEAEIGWYHSGYDHRNDWRGSGGQFLDPQTGVLHRRRGAVKYNDITLKRGYEVFQGGNPWSSGGAKVQDHNSSRSNKSSSIASWGNGDEGDTIAVMFNPREYTIAKATPWRAKSDVYVWKLESSKKKKQGFGGGGGGAKVQDHNSSRSNKSSSRVAGGDDPGQGIIKFVVKK